MSHGRRDQRPSKRGDPSSLPAQPQACVGNVAGRYPSSPSLMRNIDTVTMTEPRYTMHAPTTGAGGTAVNIIVGSPDHRQEPYQNRVTLPHHTMVIHDRPSTRSDHEIYHYQLLRKGRGYPLWVPGPGRHLPLEYRTQGINIGDVGIITQLGLFDFLFNILQPADSPIHSRGVPPSFSQKDPKGLEISTTSIYGRNTYLTSESVRTLEINSSDLKFESSAQEAAILTMPEGALTRDLLNKGAIQRCIEKNARDWYEYATGPRERIIEEGEVLGVVIGWDKVCSWGIATSTCASDQSVSLEFKVDDESGSPSQAYRWNCTGSASVRVGPQEEEISDLRQEDGAAPQNQCVFVRTMNFTVADVISDGQSSAAIQHTLVSNEGKATMTTNQSSKRGSKGQRSGLGRKGFGARQSISGQAGSHSRQCVAIDRRESEIFHPSSWIHEYLLEKYPNATLVITEDADWISVLTEEDSGFPEQEALIDRILESHEIHENGGTVKLRPRLSVEGETANAHSSKLRLPLSMSTKEQNENIREKGGSHKDWEREGLVTLRDNMHQPKKSESEDHSTSRELSESWRSTVGKFVEDRSSLESMPVSRFPSTRLAQWSPRHTDKSRKCLSPNLLQPSKQSPYLEDVNFSNPPKLRYEGQDWFVDFNPSPKVKPVLDVDLEHTLIPSTRVACVKFSQDGQWLATGCRGRAHIYDVETGVEICVLDHKNDKMYIPSVCFSPDGKYLMTGAEDKQIRLWDIAKKQIYNIFEGHQRVIQSLQMSSNGRFIVSGSADESVRIWDVCDMTSKVLTIGDHHSSQTEHLVLSVAISPDDRYVAVGRDMVVSIWDVSTGCVVQRLRGHTGTIYSVVFAPDGKGLISTSYDLTMKFWDISGLAIWSGGGFNGTSTIVPSPCLMNVPLGGRTGFPNSLTLSHDGIWVVSGYNNNAVAFWDARSGVLQCILSGHQWDPVLGVDLSPTGNLLATVGHGLVRVWSYSRFGNSQKILPSNLRAKQENKHLFSGLACSMDKSAFHC